MPINVVKTKSDEKKWEKAKSIAHGYKIPKKSKRFWKITMGVYKKMKGNKL